MRCILLVGSEAILLVVQMEPPVGRARALGQSIRARAYKNNN